MVDLSGAIVIMTARAALLTALTRAAGHDGTDRIFDWPELVVIAYRFDPGTFGLPWYHELYPDTKKIACLVAEMVPRKSWQADKGAPTLERVGVGKYRLLPAGLEIGRKGMG